VTRSIYRPPWRIDLDVREGVTRLLPGAEIARVVEAALDAVRAPRPASIGVILSDDSELVALNETHMGHEGPTDVLSFPLLDPSVFAVGAPLPDVPRPPGSRLHLGDIVVSVERAIDQAGTGRGGQTGDVRWSPADELRLLVTHGVLHVCGLDHAAPAEEASMRALEQRLLAPFAESRGDRW
jgi:probable rRNA maturation factor